MDNLIREDNDGILRGASKRAGASAWHLRNNGVREHVDAQRGGHGHDDASRYRDTSETALVAFVVIGNGASGGGEVLPSGGARCYILSCCWWNEHTDRNRGQSDTCRNVEKLFPGGGSNQFQPMVLLRFPASFVLIRDALGYSMCTVLS